MAGQRDRGDGTGAAGCPARLRAPTRGNTRQAALWRAKAPLQRPPQRPSPAACFATRSGPSLCGPSRSPPSPAGRMGPHGRCDRLVVRQGGVAKRLFTHLMRTRRWHASANAAPPAPKKWSIMIMLTSRRLEGWPRREGVGWHQPARLPLGEPVTGHQALRLRPQRLHLGRHLVQTERRRPTPGRSATLDGADAGP